MQFNRPGGPADVHAEVGLAVSERWGRTKALFLQALDLPDTERSAYLQAACGDDDALRREVESLLRNDDAAASFCESPAAALLDGDWSTPRLPRLQPGDRLGPYEIAGLIGSGGMGEVYRARDTQLRREVAIKTVCSGAEDPDCRQRLVREARHASRLCHPNICTIHEIGEAGGVPFIVMEYVAGTPLHTVLADGALSIDDGLTYGIQVADALEHAHQRGIVHRDLKPSNVVIGSHGQAVVLDFGLARRLPGAGPGSYESHESTQAGLAGTVAYMAPEVLQGHAADARSDVWGLGILLYEMATGELPFNGRTPFETSSAILGSPARPMPRRMPLALRLAIGRCLEKDPAARYQHAGEVRDALEGIQRRGRLAFIGPLLVASRRRTLQIGIVAMVLGLIALNPGSVHRHDFVPGTTRVTTIAVLPMANATGSPAAEYYVQGFGEGVVRQIGTLPNLRVVSPTSARELPAGRSPVDIGRALGAAAVVEGRLREAGETIRLDVRLIETSGGRLLRSEQYARRASEVLALQADVVRGIAHGVEVSLQPETQRRLGTVRAVDPAVYEAYLRGRYYWNQRSVASLEAAIVEFTSAIETDPTYAPAHAGLADCYNQLATQLVGAGSPKDYRPLAAAAAIAALQIDPESAEAHAALGYVRHYEWQWAESEYELQRALTLNPSYALARIWYANLLMSRGRMNEALEQVTLARELDPFSLVVNTNVAWILQFSGRNEEAVERLRWTLDLDANYVQARQRLGDSLADLGRIEEAIEEAHRVVALTRRSPAGLVGLAHFYARARRVEEARKIVFQLTGPGGDYVPPGSLAVVFAALGDREAALDWLDRAFDEGSNLMAYLAVHPSFRSLADHPRFRTLLERTGLASP